MLAPVRTEIEIDAPPEHVFGIILDLDAYPEWNRFTPRITLRTADVAVGAELDLDCQMTPTELLVNEREVILAIDREQLRFCMGTSRKRGRPGIRSERWQTCERLPSGRTRYVNQEAFTGPLAPIVYLLYRKKLGRAFEQHDRDLKRRAESTRK